METLQIINLTRGTVLGRRISLADNLWTRFLGLIGRKRLAEGEGLHILPCSSVHMFFMRMSLDVVYLDKGLRVTKTVRNLRPWRISAGAKKSKSVLELPVGAIARSRTEPGDQLAASTLAG